MGYRDYSTAKGRIVDASGHGDFTTIASALAISSAGDTLFIRPGIYTESLILVNGVNLSGYNFQGGSGARTLIVGKLIDNGGTVNTTLTNLSLKTNSDYIISWTGSGDIVLDGVNLNCLNNTGINLSASGGVVKLYNCIANLGTTGIGFWTGSSSLTANGCTFTNSGSSTTASSTSGSINISQSSMASPIATSAGGGVTATNFFNDCSLINTAALTTAGSGTCNLYGCELASGTASAISVGTGTIVNSYTHSLLTSNANPVTGAGTFNYSNITNNTNTGILNPSTLNGFPIYAGGISFDGGNNFLKNYVTGGTFTPTLVGASTAGTTTYTTQIGYYTRIGNLVSVQGVAIITAATGTGNALIGGLPFTINNSTQGQPVGACNVSAAGWAWPVGTTQTNPVGIINTTTAQVNCTGSTVASNFLQMTNAAATIRFNITYFI